jgi:hypothetical protein
MAPGEQVQEEPGMTEEEWLAGNNPRGMLSFLRDGVRPRKLRLFACACCRRIWHLLAEAREREAVEVAERYADWRGVRKAEAKSAGRAARPAFADFDTPRWDAGRAAAGCCAVFLDAPHGAYLWEQAADTADQAASALLPPQVRAADRARWPAEAAWREERAAQAHLLRCIFGNPFRPVNLAPPWRAQPGDTLFRLAMGAYDERDLPAGTLLGPRLAALADALEAAGCDQADLLGHLRSPGPHVRGCWPIEAVLGRP